MKTITKIVYNFVRKQLAKRNMGQGKGITSLPGAADIEIGMTDVYDNLRKGGLDAVSASKAIKSEDDLARTLAEINALDRDKKLMKDYQQQLNQDPNRLDIIMDKLEKGIPLNPSDQFDQSGDVLEAFQGFTPKVIQGGKSEGIEKLLESGDVKKGVAPKTTKETIKRKSMIDPKLTQEENIKKIMEENKASAKRLEEKMKDPDKKAEGGLMRLGMFAGGTPLRRLLQYLAGTSGKKGSENLKDLNVSDQLKFFAEKQGLNPDQAKIEYLEQVLDTLKKDKDLIKSVEPSPAKNELENIASKAFRESFIDMTQSGRFKGLDSDMIDKSILETETILKNLKTGGRKPNAEGGLMRLGFEKGGMSRRGFLKLMGGLAAIPLVGKFFKPVAKATKAVEVAAKSSGVPAYFPKLVEKIQLLGDDVTKTRATGERQVVKDYKGYELTEDLDTGKLSIKRDNYTSEDYLQFEPGGQYYDETRKKVIKYPETYEEVTVRPDYEGKMKDVDYGIDDIDEIMREVDMIDTDYKMSPSGKLRNKKASGGLAYMLGM